MAEPCALIVIFVTLGMILPLFFPCTPTQARCGAGWPVLGMTARNRPTFACLPSVLRIDFIAHLHLPAAPACRAVRDHSG